ncbi:MAG TPA: hypothetical protein VE076_07035 [Nitrososphaeraceae archaeon]|nr:hypothetical protein [Nitrososphaeraceae archaeon]
MPEYAVLGIPEVCNLLLIDGLNQGTEEIQRIKEEAYATDYAIGA